MQTIDHVQREEGSTTLPPPSETSLTMESLSAKLVSTLDGSLPKLGLSLHPADDKIYRVPSIEPAAGKVVLHDIRPVKLSWLQFIISVNVVHEDDKLYSLFSRQCYWFSTLIFLLVHAKFCIPQATTDIIKTWDGDKTDCIQLSRPLGLPPPSGPPLIRIQPENGPVPGTRRRFMVASMRLPLLEKIEQRYDERWKGEREMVSSLENYCSSRFIPLRSKDG